MGWGWDLVSIFMDLIRGFRGGFCGVGEVALRLRGVGGRALFLNQTSS